MTVIERKEDQVLETIDMLLFDIFGVKSRKATFFGV